MTAELRSLREEDLEESLELSQFAFQYVMTPEELEKKKRIFPPEWTLGWFENERLAAKATFLQMRMWIGGEVYPMGGVAGVATWPEYRRGGKVDALLKQGLALMKSRGEAVSMLAPFSFDFYHKYGWAMMTELKHYTLDASHIADLHAFRGRSGGRVLRVNAAERIELLNGLYRQYAKGFNGMVDRDAWWWDVSVLQRKKGQAAVYEDAQGQPKGYILYKVADREMKVHELIWLDDDARAGLLAFAANHDSMAKTMKLTLPSSDRLPLLVKNPRFQQETEPYFMFRVVDARAFLPKYRFAAAAAGLELGVSLTDAAAPWNDGEYRLRIGVDGHAELLSDGKAGEGIRCGISELSSMLIGAARPAFLRGAGLLQGDDEAIRLWDTALPNHDTYLADFF